MMLGKLAYFAWAVRRAGTRNSPCPSCSSRAVRRLRRKYLVTSLWECQRCFIRFRIPRETPEDASRFYQQQYRAGFTTDCPDDEELARLLATRFQGTEKDYSDYLQVLDAAGVRRGNIVLDFGSSWGYGSWQLQQAGFEVYSYEISQARADYAARKLGCRIICSFKEIPDRVQCFFSAHVIEHLPDPNVMWRAVSRAMGREGTVVVFTPNGNPDLETAYGSRRYHRLWGKVHPMLITPQSLREMANRHGFMPYVFSSPYSTERIRLLEPDVNPLGSELLLVARRQAEFLR